MTIRLSVIAEAARKAQDTECPDDCNWVRWTISSTKDGLETTGAVELLPATVLALVAAVKALRLADQHLAPFFGEDSGIRKRVTAALASFDLSGMG